MSLLLSRELWICKHLVVSLSVIDDLKRSNCCSNFSTRLRLFSDSPELMRVSSMRKAWGLPKMDRLSILSRRYRTRTGLDPFWNRVMMGMEISELTNLWKFLMTIVSICVRTLSFS